MAYTRRTLTGGAVATTITGNITSGDTTINIAATTGWPTGSPNGDFLGVINRGGSTEEKVRFASRTGGALTVQSGGRGADGTTASAHNSGETIEISLTGIDLDEANYAVSQTVGLISAAGDLLIGTALNTLVRLAKGANGTVLRVNAGTVGWNQVTAAEIATSALGSGLTGANGTPIAVNVDNSTLEIVTNIVRVKDQGITYAKMQNMTTARLHGRTTAGSGSVEELTAGAGLVLAAGNLGRAALTGDVTAAADSNATTLGAVVNNSKMASGFRANTVGTSHPGSPVAGDLDYDTANNLLYVYNGTSWVCITPQAATVATLETRANAAYGALATAGPVVTINTGTKAIVTVSANMGTDTAGTFSFMSFAVSGATTLAAADARSVDVFTGSNVLEGGRQGVTILVSGLTAGANTFTAQYRVTGGTGSFGDRNLTVVGVP